MIFNSAWLRHEHRQDLFANNNTKCLSVMRAEQVIHAALGPTAAEDELRQLRGLLASTRVEARAAIEALQARFRVRTRF